ncbi:MAG: transglutaminaseTgpA domain-containing protein [Terriglobales bacterium]
MRRTSEALLLLLLATGFATLASTGGLGAVVVALGAAAYLARGYALLTGQRWRWSSRAWSLALLAYLPVFVWDGLLLSHSFLEASLHLVVLAGAARLFAPYSGRDDFLLGLLAFLEVLTAALLTVSGVFFLLLLLFFVLLVATLVSFETARAQEAAALPDGGGIVAPAGAVALRIPRTRLLGFALVLSLMVGSCGAVVFFLLPRTALGGWGARPLGRGLSGFSDDVRLGAIASLQRSNRPVMHIKLVDAGPPLSAAAFEAIPWRGRGLTTFNGRRWFDPDTPDLFGTDSGRIQVGLPTVAGTARIVRYQVTLEPLHSPVLFFPPRLLRAATDFPVLAWDRYSDTLAGLGANLTGASYSGVSDFALPGPQDLRLQDGWPPGRFRLRRYLQLPEHLDGRIPVLARRIVAGVPANNWARMQALTDYLQTHYPYTLQDLPQGQHPLATFLFDSRGGDCEYFASALAVMARTLDIPTRVVNGFLLGPYNPITGQYLVRGSDAHTWVEADFPTSYVGREHGFGRTVWITYDPTPAASGSASLPESGMLLDALSSTWQRWIVNYDWFRQARLAAVLQQNLGFGAGGVWSQAGSDAKQVWSQLHTKPGSRSGGWRAWGWLLLLLLAGVVAGLSLWRGRAGTAGGSKHPDGAGAAARRQAQRAYRRAQRDLAGCGLAHAPAQTAEELLGALRLRQAPEELAAALAGFLGTYQQMRFGTAPAAALPRLRVQLQHLRRLCHRARLSPAL